MNKKWRRIFICAGIAAGSALSALFLAKVPVIQTLHLKARDIHYVVRGSQPTNNIILVVIDDKSLDTFHDPQLFWHPYYAEAIRAAANADAKVLAFDVAFGIPVGKWEANHDQLLGETVASVAPKMPVICAYVPGRTGRETDLPVQINMLAAAFGLSAFANLTVDPDDFVRNQELIEPPAQNSQDPVFHSMALRTAEKYLGSEAQYQNGRLSLNGEPIPISPERTIAINYAGGPGTFPRVSLSDFIGKARAGDEAQLRKWVQGKAVLLGPDNIDDRHPTPFFTMFSGTRWETPGVEIHANTLRTLLERRFLVPVPDWVRVLSLLAATAATVYIATWLGVASSAIGMAVMLCAIAVLTHLLFRAGFLLSTSEMMLACLICLVGSIVYRFASAEERSALFRSAVALFVGKQVATALDQTSKISLSGRLHLVTILFTDIRGFTAFCEEKPPNVVVDLLNDYMAKMVKIIVKHKGQVNKFIGDGILAIFSDEDGSVQGDHPTRAVQCATELVSTPGQFKTGAGIHTGPVVIGNVGSSDKMEYTVLGDTVNLASRLESLNKEHKTKLLLSEATRDLMSREIETEYLGAVSVRGKTVPMNLYTVTALVDKKQPVPSMALAGAEERS